MNQVNMTSERDGRWVSIAMILVLLVIALAMFFDVLFLDRVLLTSSQRLMFPWAYGEDLETLQSERSFRWDATLNYYPRRLLAHESLTSGHLPLWNPHSAAGMPLLADFQSAVYYPPNFVLNLGDPLRAMGWTVFLHVFLAGLGTYGFLRFRGMSRPASLFGGIAYMLNGFLMTRVGHPTMVQAAAWLPCLLFVVDRVLESGRPRWFVGLGVAVALSVLSGFPQITIHCFTAAILYLLYRSVILHAPIRTVVWALLFGVVGIGLAGLQIVPTLEFARQSGRTAQDLGAGLWHTPAVSFLKLLVPEVTGNAVEGTNWIGFFKGPDAHPNDIGLVAYVGILPLVFGLLSLARLHRDPEVRFFWALAVLVVLGSMFRPVFSFLYLFVPGAGAAQPDRLAFLLSFCLALLGAKGLTLILEKDARNERGLFAGALGIVLGGLALIGALALWTERILSHLARSLSPAISSELWARPFSPRVQGFLSGDLDGWVACERSCLLWPTVFLVAALVLILLWRWGRVSGQLRWVAVAIAVFDLFLFGRAYYTPQPAEEVLREPPAIQYLRESRSEPSRIVRAFSDQALAPNFNVVLGIDDAQGYNALMVDRYGRLFDLVERGTYAQRKKIDAPGKPGSFASPVLDLLNVEYILAEGSLEMSRRLAGLPPFSEPGLCRVYARDLLIYRNEDVLPRATWLPGARFFAAEGEVAAEIVQPGYDPARAVLLEESAGRVPWWAALGGKEGQARQVAREPLRVILDASSEGPGWLRWAETYYPGWRVEVDGAEVRSWRSDLALRAIPVPAGRHRIELRMDPVSTRAGAGLTLFSVMLLVLLGLGCKPRLQDSLR
ncbi:MAG: YfhO family protein [Candidatus Eisenbacteria sp.]|nr:YfhO family protein [Candidatus Eisenbacteria bacterium]